MLCKCRKSHKTKLISMQFSDEPYDTKNQPTTLYNSIAMIALGCQPAINQKLITRPESNMLKNLPKMLPGIFLKIHLLCFSVFLLCLHYTPKLPIILSIVMKNLK